MNYKLNCKRNPLIAIALFLFLTTSFASIALAIEETGGVGMTVAQLYDESRPDRKGSLVVLDVFNESPAERGGVKRGDIITHINDQPTRGKEVMEIVTKEIRGAEGSELKLKIWRYSEKKRIEATLVRVLMVY